MDATQVKRGQFRLRTLLLIVAAVASWLAWHQAASDVHQLKQELPGLRRATRELIIGDPNEFAVVEKPQIWAGEFRWEVYVPEGRTGHVHLALDAITSKGYPTPACSLAVQSGVNMIEYQLEKNDGGWSFSLGCGDKVEKTTRPNEWQKRSVFTNYVQRLTETSGQSTDSPLDLMRNRVRDGQINTDAEQMANESAEVDGQLVWVELD